MGWVERMHRFCGYVHIRADGVFLERFLNICAHRNLRMWNVCRSGEGRLTANMCKDDYLRIRPIAYRTQTHVRILSRHGLPFFLHRYRKRRFALIGLCAAVGLLWYCSSHIMGICVFGNQRIPTEEIMMHLSGCGIAMGKSVRNIDSSSVRNRLMRDMDDLAWVGINVSGSRVYVEIVERIEEEEKIAMDIPCHLLAKKDGEIEKLIAREGQTVVKRGSGVRAGDLLVSGLVDNTGVGYRYVHAYGEVIAKTRYTQSAEYPLVYEETVDTGEKKTRRTLQIVRWEIPLFFNDQEPYALCRTEENERVYRLPTEVSPSLKIKTKRYYAQKTEQKVRTAQEAIRAATVELEARLRSEIPTEAEVIDQTVETTLTERETVRVAVTMICREDIAESVPIQAVESGEMYP